MYVKLIFIIKSQNLFVTNLLILDSIARMYTLGNFCILVSLRLVTMILHYSCLFPLSKLIHVMNTMVQAIILSLDLMCYVTYLRLLLNLSL